MIAFIILFTVLILAVVEYFSRRDDLRHLDVRFELDSRLVEPGEEIYLRYTISNTSIWPVLYAGFTLRLDSVFRVCEDEDWLSRHGSIDFTGTRVEQHFTLLPRRKINGKLRICVNRRGFYSIGKYFLEYGDFLGLRPKLISKPVGLRIICTAETCDTPELRALGGELGDVSVRRFIMDDPNLLIGYREYTGREPMKQISWNQTAKIGRLMVRQNDFTTDRIAVVMVNMDPINRDRLEHCLCMVRTVCEKLEEARIPYALHSNGDLFSLEEGRGRGHLFFVQRRIGLSRLTGFTSFAGLVERSVFRRSTGCTYIVISPGQDAEFLRAVDQLARRTGTEPIVLCGEEDAS